MATFKFGRKARARKLRKTRAAPLLPEPIGARAFQRANRVLAAVSLFGAFGTVALAVALTPGAQPTASGANAAKVPLAASVVETQAKLAEPSPPAPVRAALPERPAKTDRVTGTQPSPQAVAVDPAPEPEPVPLRRSVREPINLVMAPETPATAPETPATAPETSATAPETPATAPETPATAPETPATAGETPATAGEAAPEAEADLRQALEAEEEPEVWPAAGSGTDVFPPGDTSAGTADEAGAAPLEEVSAASIEEAIDDAVEEAIDIAVEEAAPEPAPEPAPATRQAAVTTDVNLRAGPDNGAAVILVVPGKSDVEVIGCDYWCEVVYAGKRGWIYKGFVRGAKS